MKNLLYITITKNPLLFTTSILYLAVVLFPSNAYSNNEKPEPTFVEIEKIQDVAFGDCYRLSNDEVSVLVSPRTGRIVFYGFTMGKNQLWTNPQAVAYKKQIGNWVNWGGDKVWIWPQGDWHQITGRTWPPPEHADGKPWQINVVKNDDNSHLRLTSEIIPRYNIKIVRTIKLASKGTQLTLETRFVPVQQAASVNYDFAVWTVTQVPSGKGVYARVLPEVIEPIIHPMAGSKPWQSLIRLENTRIVFLPREGDDWSKGGLDADLLAVRNGQVMLVQKAKTSGKYSSGKFRSGERAQICSSPDNSISYPSNLPSYFELEYTSPLASAIDTESHLLTVQWSLHKFANPKVADDEIASFLESF